MVQPYSRHIADFRRSPDFADEVRQLVREHLFLGRDGGTPHIADYGARGPLATWLGIVARHIAYNLIRGRDPLAPWGWVYEHEDARDDADLQRDRGRTALTLAE